MKKTSNHAIKVSGYRGSKREMEYEDDDVPFGTRKVVKEQQKRRPIRNLTKAWYDHGNHFEEVEDFYGK